MTRRFVVVVLDGFGIGAMEDVPQVRPDDIGANSALHILEATGLSLPTLERLGLCNAMGCLPERQCLTATFGQANLAHFGADTFFGHQEIMGTKPFMPVKSAFYHDLPRVAQGLRAAGHHVETRTCGKAALLLIDHCLTVGDNIEADLGQAYNVTAALDNVAFAQVLAVARQVRAVGKVSRVIAFGGQDVNIAQILAAAEHKTLEGEEYYGVNAPRSGVYNTGYQCIHLGYGVNPAVQLPGLLAEHGIPVVLLGKVADIVENPQGRSCSIVDTTQVLQTTLDCFAELEQGFICTNVQETDLCGHRMDIAAYADRLRVADEYLAQLVQALRDDDVLLVMADHGNDPCIGHSRHTRERVPLLLAGNVRPNFHLGLRTTLSDVGATIAEYFGTRPPEHGQSFWREIRG